jgi:purine-cytosine permease-like protein
MSLTAGDSPSAAETAPQGSSRKAFAIEQRGIGLVGQQERHGRPGDLFWMWLGSNLNVFYPVNGALVIYLGLSFSQAVAAILLGNLIFFGVGLASLQGPKTGTSTFAVSRAAYGQNGGKSLSLLNWATCVGFEASGMALIVLAGLAVLGNAGVAASTGLKILLLVVAMCIQVLLPVFGHQTIVTIQRYFAYLLVPLFAIMAIVVAGRVHLGSLSHGSGWAGFTVAIALLISAGGLSWANTGSDYSRYLPSTARPRNIFWSASIGGMLPAVLLEILGAGIASVVNTASDPISGLPHALPSWIVTPYLVVAIVTLFAVNTIDLYSSGLTLQAIGLKIKRWQCVLVDMVIATIVAAITIFNSNFNRLYSDFLSLLIVWLSPWLAIYLIDWWMRHGRYDAPALLQDRGGRYWRSGGFHLPGVIAQIAGMTAACLWIDSPAFVGPLSSRTAGSDMSFFMGLIAGGLIYYLLARRSVQAETAGLVPASRPHS